MTGDPWIQPQGPWDQQVQSRLVGPADVRSVMFATTRMKVGYEVAEVDAFLDRVEMSMEHMIGEIQSLRRRIAATDQANEARMYDIRLALEQLLVHLGGPTGQPSGVIDPNGQEVPLFPGVNAKPAAPGRFGPPQGPVNSSAPPASAPAAGFSPGSQAPAGFPTPGVAPAAAGFGPPVAPPAAPSMASPPHAAPPMASPPPAAPPMASPPPAAPPMASPPPAAPPMASPPHAAPPMASPPPAAPPMASPPPAAPPMASPPPMEGYLPPPGPGVPMQPPPPV